MIETVVPLMEGQNSSMTVSHWGRGRRKTKGIQRVDSTMAAANSNHTPAAILHTTRRVIKYNLAAKVGELTHKHKAKRDGEHGKQQEQRMKW